MNRFVYVSLGLPFLIRDGKDADDGNYNINQSLEIKFIWHRNGKYRNKYKLMVVGNCWPEIRLLFKTKIPCLCSFQIFRAVSKIYQLQVWEASAVHSVVSLNNKYLFIRHRIANNYYSIKTNLTAMKFNTMSRHRHVLVHNHTIDLRTQIASKSKTVQSRFPRTLDYLWPLNLIEE